MATWDAVFRTLDDLRAALEVLRADRPLTWRPPVLTAPTAITVTNANRDLALRTDTDYQLVCGEVLTDSLTIRGGRNIVALGFEIMRPTTPDKPTRAACFLTSQAAGGTIHLEGWKVGGTGIHDGIDIQQQNKNTVQIQNFFMTEHHAVDQETFSDIHPDVIQTWWGPDRLYVDGLSANYRYQGIFLEPDDKPGQYLPTLTDFRNVDLRLADDLSPTGKRSKAYWLHTAWPHNEANIWVEIPPQLTVRQAVAPASLCDAVPPVIFEGRPPVRMVNEDAVGLGYVSPGYA